MLLPSPAMSNLPNTCCDRFVSGYVCDTPAGDCPHWEHGHCMATHADSEWRARRAAWKADTQGPSQPLQETFLAAGAQQSRLPEATGPTTSVQDVQDRLIAARMDEQLKRSCLNHLRSCQSSELCRICAKIAECVSRTSV
mmetsp:Transcript_38399/g.76941  ORF Transcript_38399/g.76941 Transcript_38399/m.76941 type:complete len:140 (-) Transcript_38399:339-758(-)